MRVQQVNSRNLTTCYLLIFIGFLAAIVDTCCKPTKYSCNYTVRAVPDSTGTSFLFTTPYCAEEYPLSMYIVPQTTLAVNLTLTSYDSKQQLYVPPGGALRHNISCMETSWNHKTKAAFRLAASGEITLYIDYSETSCIVFPVDVLSTRYTVITPLTSGFDSAFFSVTGNYTVLAIELPTTLEKTVKINDTIFTPGARLNIYLEEDETILVSCLCDLTGIKITSSLKVSVMAGAFNSSNSELTLIQQLLPEASWGRRFIFNRHAWISNNITLNIVAKHKQTSVSLFLKDKTISAQIPDQLKITMHIVVNDFIAIEADKSVSCLVLVELYDATNEAHWSILNLPPVALYPFRFSFVSVDSSLMSLDMTITLNSFSHVSFNKSSDLHPFARPMTYFWNYFICRNIEIISPHSVLINDNNISPLFAIAYLRSDSNVRIYPLGNRVTALFESCITTPASNGGNGDGIDNDCDSLIDEEILNGKDDDGDGLVDEDTVYSGDVQHKHVDMAWEYYQRKRAENQETGIASSVVSILISIGVGLSGVGCFIGFMFLVDKLKRKWENNMRIEPCA